MMKFELNIEELEEVAPKHPLSLPGCSSKPLKVACPAIG